MGVNKEEPCVHHPSSAMEINIHETYFIYCCSPLPLTPLQNPSSSSSPSPEKISFQFTLQTFKFVFNEPHDLLYEILEEVEYPPTEPLRICVDAAEVDGDSFQFYLSVYKSLERIGIPGSDLHSLATSIIESAREVKRGESSPNPRFNELFLEFKILEVDVVTTSDPSPEIENAIRESTWELEETNYGMVPTSERGKERMLKIITVTGEQNSPVNDGSDGRERKRKIRRESLKVANCAICLEDIPAGSRAAQVPCSHVFHSTCIKKWLGVSHFCPTCRFEFPAVLKP